MARRQHLNAVCNKAGSEIMLPQSGRLRTQPAELHLDTIQNPVNDITFMEGKSLAKRHQIIKRQLMGGIITISKKILSGP